MTCIITNCNFWNNSKPLGIKASNVASRWLTKERKLLATREATGT